MKNSWGAVAVAVSTLLFSVTVIAASAEDWTNRSIYQVSIYLYHSLTTLSFWSPSLGSHRPIRFGKWIIAEMCH